jgi:hypothetical protein
VLLLSLSIVVEANAATLDNFNLDWFMAMMLAHEQFKMIREKLIFFSDIAKTQLLKVLFYYSKVYY